MPRVPWMVRVKVCGITNIDDALLAVDLGASAVGFVFWRNSPRYVDPGRARDIVAKLPCDVSAIGVFVDPLENEVRSVVEDVGLTAIQLHGDERPQFYQALAFRTIKAVGVTGRETISEILTIPNDVMVLLDANDKILRGGTGKTTDWEIAFEIASTRRVFLAGGLTAGNVAQAIATVRPYGIDVSSGVESAPGLKDSSRLRKFFKAVKSL